MIRAYVSEDFPGMTIALSLVQQDDGQGPTRILRIVEAGDNPVIRWEDVPDPPIQQIIPPTIRFGDREARAILEALSNHYGGAEDTRALRRDYDAERKRVDNLTESLASIAQSLSGQVS